MNQELFESTSIIKVGTMKNMDNFCLEGKPTCTSTKPIPFAVNQDVWDTKDTGKSMKNALYLHGMP